VGMDDEYQSRHIFIIAYLIGLFCFVILGLIGSIILIIIILLTTLWVYYDAKNLGAKPADGSWSPRTIALLVLLFWIIALPIYILRRHHIFETAKRNSERDAELLKIKNEMSVNKTINDDQIEILKKYDKKYLITFFDEIFNQYELDGGLEKNEILTLQKMQGALGLTNDDIKFEEKLLPHILVYSIRSENKLPLSTIHFPENISNIILKNGEEMHYSTSVILKESRVVNLGYVGGSSGISIPIGKGIRYRVGATRGHINKEERMIMTSRGFLIITNQRLLLQPLPGHKPVSIPLNKILSYHCFENGIEIYKEGREKGFFFQTFTLGSPEVFGIILEFLLHNK
jgi:hypothetical protein